MPLRLPKRLSDPRAPARSYVARRAGMGDQLRAQRRVRELERQPRPDQILSVETIGQLPLDAEALDINQIYRVQGAPGVADRLFYRRKDATDTTALAPLSTAAIESLPTVPLVGDLDPQQLYRVLGASGVADTLVARMKNAANTLVVQAISLVGHIHAQYSLIGHTHTVTIPDMFVAFHGKTVSPLGVEEDTVVCPTDYMCTGGGVQHSAAGDIANISDSYPESNGWRARVFNGDPANSLSMTTYAVCLFKSFDTSS